MKILVVGGGGREHAIIKALKKNKYATEIYALPGNGGINRWKGNVFPSGLPQFRKTEKKIYYNG